MKYVQKQCDEMLQDGDINIGDRQKRIKQLTDSVLKDNGEYNDCELLDFISRNIKLIRVQWDSETLKNNVQSYGKINENMNNPLVTIPNIKLEMPIKTEDLDDGYKIKMKWSVSGYNEHKQKNLSRSFIIRYKKIIQFDHKQNEDEEKQILLTENNHQFPDQSKSQWIVATHKIIQMVDNNDNDNDNDHDNNDIFEVDIVDKFEYNICYKYQVLVKIHDPIDFLIESNYIDLVVTNVVKIELQQYRQRAHYSESYHPKQMLNENAQGYGSALVQDFKINESDWVIFKLKDGENLYFPKKFIIKSFGNEQSVKTMRVFIGDNDKNEWYLFEPNMINVEKNNEYQIFEINGIDPNVVKLNELRQIKLEFITNHGCKSGCKFFIYEFQLYGIRL